jgi:hypothetical protein
MALAKGRRAKEMAKMLPDMGLSYQAGRTWRMYEVLP